MAYEQHIEDTSQIVARVAVITLSDTRTPETDKSGQAIQKLLTDAGHSVAHYALVRDVPIEPLQRTMEHCLGSAKIEAVITNGGTGVARRDLAVPTLEGYIEQPLPGFGELFRMLSYEQIGSGAMLSRAFAGIARGKPLFVLPGSTKAVELAMTRLILPEIAHILGELRK